MTEKRKTLEEKLKFYEEAQKENESFGDVTGFFKREIEALRLKINRYSGRIHENT